MTETTTHAFVLKVKPGMGAEYKRRHDALWPEMREALLQQGILHYEIYLHEESGMLFAHQVRRRPPAPSDLTDEIVQRWRTHMQDIMEFDGATPYRRVLERIFLLEADVA